MIINALLNVTSEGRKILKDMKEKEELRKDTLQVLRENQMDRSNRVFLEKKNIPYLYITLFRYLILLGNNTKRCWRNGYSFWCY